MSSRKLFLRVVLFLSLIGFLLIFVNLNNHAAATQSNIFGYCSSTPDQSPVYFSAPFDTGIDNSRAPDSTPIQNEYSEYLKGRFDFKSNSNFPTICRLYQSLSQTQSLRRDYESQMRQENKQVVEVEWIYRPEPGVVIASAPRPGTARPTVNTAQADHTFCISDAYQNTVYFTGPVASPPPVAMYQWANGYTQFLKTKYSFQGRVYCNMGTVDIARGLVNAHLEGVRAAGRKVVQADWKYDASQTPSASASRPADQDDDRQPAQRPAQQAPNLQARDFVRNERPAALAYCVHNREMSAAFDCDCLLRQIARYRLDHVSDTLGSSPTPVEQLFNGDKVDFTSCIQAEWKFKIAVRAAARSQKASDPVADCAVDKMRTLLQAKPHPNESKEILNAAIAACR